MINYVFVHIPKTAGTSFKKGLDKVIGKNKIAYDYGQDSKDTSDSVIRYIYNKDKSAFEELESHTIIAGHFCADKYHKYFPGAKFITFVRNPVERAWSEFMHVKRHYGYRHSFEEFVMNPEQRNQMVSYFGKLSIDDFEFIGLTSEYKRSLDIFKDKCGLCLPEYNYNRGSGRKILLSQEEVKLVEEYNAADIVLYNNIRKLFFD